MPRRDLDDLLAALSVLDAVSDQMPEAAQRAVIDLIRILGYHEDEEWKRTHPPLAGRLVEVRRG